ncbi:MAG: hypothetical protein E7369_02025, partial [Clostridiales bacterium]|nr:hypothetical protein [Clostridiales bacterium]
MNNVQGIQLNPQKKSNKLVDFIRNNQAILLSLIITGLVALVFGIFLANKGMTPAEGWYSYYAKLINKDGLVPYKDFQLLFPPLYTYTIALFTKIFGYEIMALRVLGVLIYVTLSVFANLIFYKLLKNPVFSCVIGILVFAYLQSEIAQISYDYIRFMDVTVYVALFAFLCFFEKRDKIQKRKYLFLDCALPSVIVCGVFSAFASLFKQSSGLIFAFGIGVLFVFFIITSKEKLKLLYSLIWYCISIAVVYGLTFIFLAANGALSSYFHYVYGVAANSKGGLFTVLFANFFKTIPSLLKTLPIVAVILLLIVGAWFYNKKHDKDQEISQKKSLIIMGVLGGATLLLLILSFCFAGVGSAFSNVYYGNVINLIFVINAIVMILFFVAIIIKKDAFLGDKVFNENMFIISFIAFILAYAVCMSGGLCQSQVALCFGVTASVLFKYVRLNGKAFVSIILSGVFSF